MEGFVVQGWDLIVPGCGISMLSRGATLATRSLHRPSRSDQQSADGGGVSTPAGRYRLGESLQGEGVEDVWDDSWYRDGLLSSRGWGRISTWSRGETLAACWLHEPPPTSNQSIRRDFHTVQSGIELGDQCCRSRSTLQMYGTISGPGMGPYRPWVPLAP